MYGQLRERVPGGSTIMSKDSGNGKVHGCLESEKRLLRLPRGFHYRNNGGYEE